MLPRGCLVTPRHKHQITPRTSDEAPPNPSDPTPTSANAPEINPKAFRLISWNIDFHQPYGDERIAAALIYLSRLLSTAPASTPQVIFLQEMTPSDSISSEKPHGSGDGFTSPILMRGVGAARITAPRRSRRCILFLHSPSVAAGLIAGDFNAIQPFDRTLHFNYDLKDTYLKLGGEEDSHEGYTWGYKVPD
ncbi:hypothetical protein K458DRAFT_390406 [Lentithecium fluviatile CBS 122367]|uniref:Endonuclease/exonuclease/phosphatase domain-containing protein n=1 Tax=Lentithecium fluviatile CBS 122367 TaxID=1168545 RepID=A0A6G1IY13_9PLEO|nr:hypothetical protein K458DRAFT_390406 [Lentithecium fluviatile CBS 122367]